MHQSPKSPEIERRVGLKCIFDAPLHLYYQWCDILFLSRDLCRIGAEPVRFYPFGEPIPSKARAILDTWDRILREPRPYSGEKIGIQVD